MAIEFETFYAAGISQLSYLIGDSRAGVAGVVDPRPDVDVYLRTARAKELAITHIFETHIHADFASGARELAARTGARVCSSGEGDARYEFDNHPIHDGDVFTFGKVRLTARHTPGHTPEHISYEIANADNPEKPWGVLSGDALFVGSVGRPDLLGREHTGQLAGQLHKTMREYFLKLDDAVMVYPGHGHGSECGPGISDLVSTTIGYERKHNEYLQIDDHEKFREQILGAAPPAPKHYPRLKQVNRAGPPVLGAGPLVQPLTVAAFKSVLEQKGCQLVDTRHMLAFGGGHIPGALNIGHKPMMSVWAGWMLDPDKPILLVLEDDRRLDEIVALLVRTGFYHFAGYLVGGMSAWENAGERLQTLPQITVHDLHERRSEYEILDVRTPAEWRAGHVPGARNIFVPELQSDGQLARERPITTYCGSGYRANIAASLLQQRGYPDVRNVVGSWQAWQNAGLPVETDVR